MQNVKVEVEFKDIRKNSKYLELAKEIIARCFKEEKLNNNLYVSIILTNEENIRKLNKQYRNIDKETDVLSFPMFEKGEDYISECLGDIVISIPKVKAQSKEYGHSFKREFSYMIAHGFYHLIGYDHENESEKKIMRKKEEKVVYEK